MYELRAAGKTESHAIRMLIWRVGINPLGLDWHRFVVVVDDRDRLVACGQVKPHADGSRELASIAVAPECRGQGYARQVIEALQNQHGAPLHLMCASHLQPLYRKFGFRSLQPNEMPLTLSRYYRLMAFFTDLFHQPPPLAIMLWEGS